MSRRGICLVGLLFLMSSKGSFAMEPFWAEGGQYLIFRAEPGDIAKETHFMAIVSGVQTWYRSFESCIEGYANATGPLYCWLPNSAGSWGYRQATPQNLTNAIWYYRDLGLGDVPYTPTYANIERAINADRQKQPWNGFSYAGSTCFDPYVYWRWRSHYMERRYQENGDTTSEYGWPVANCWGTADYLAGDTLWITDYESVGRNDDFQSWFPHVYLDTIRVNDQTYLTIDNDLDGSRGNSVLTTYGEASSADPKRLNAFDVIRLGSINSANPKQMFGVEVGLNMHCAAYICRGKKRYQDIDPYGSSTDSRKVTYIYEKHGKAHRWDTHTGSHPYGLSILFHGGWVWANASPEVVEPDGWDAGFNAHFRKPASTKKLVNHHWCESDPFYGSVSQRIKDDEVKFYEYRYGETPACHH